MQTTPFLSALASSFTAKKVNLLIDVANYLFLAEIFDKAIDFYKQLLNDSQKALQNGVCDTAVVNCNCYVRNGICLLRLDHYSDELHYLEESLVIARQTTPNTEFDSDIAAILGHNGHCHFERQNINKA